MTSTPEPRTFTLFPDLPTELRLRIWHFVSPGPRTISIRYTTRQGIFDGKTISTFTGWRSPDPPPRILSINREARSVGLESYVPAFGSYFHKSRIYVDFDIDTVRFGSVRGDGWVRAGPGDYLLDVFLGGGYHGGDDEEKIQSLIIDVSESLYERKEFCWAEASLFRGLKKLTFIPWEEDEKRVELMRYYREMLEKVTRTYPEWVVPEITVLSALSGKVWGNLRIST